MSEQVLIRETIASTSEPTLRERLGGRWAISWQAIVISLPFAPVVLVSNESSSWEEVGGWLVAAMFGIAAVAGVTYLFHRTIYRNRSTHPVAIPVVVASAAFTMFLLIGVETAVGLLLGLPYVHSPMYRGCETIFIGVWWSVGVVLFLEGRWRFALERNAVVDRAVQQRLASMQEAEVIGSIRQALSQDVAGELESARVAVERHLVALNDRSLSADDAAGLLRDTAERSVRPLSHRLAESAKERLSRPRLRDTFRNIINRQQFRPLAVSAIYLFAAGPRDLERYGWGEGLLRIAVIIGLIFALMSISNWALRRWPQHHAKLFIAGICLIEAPSIAIPVLTARAQNTAVPWMDIIFSVVVGIMIIFVTSGFGSWRNDRRDLLRTFASDVRQDEVETIANSRALATAAREAAGVLHGAVQTKLVACAMAIDHAAATGDVVAVNQALMQARAILEQPIASATTNEGATLAELVNRKATLWQGLTDVQIHIDPTVAHITGRFASTVADIVEEGIANAVQHGAAKRISVNISLDSYQLQIVIADNGCGPTGGTPGLGSRMLDALDGSWRLEEIGGGAQLKVSLPMSEHMTISTGV